MSRHWSNNASALNQLASQYVLGTLQGRARRRFEALIAQRADVAERVADWEARLHRLAQTLPPVAPRPALWEALAKQAGLPSNGAAPSEPSLAQRLSRFVQALLAPVPAGALALGLLGGLVIPQVYETLSPAPLADTELPESYVGVLAAADGRPGLIVASRRYGRAVDLKQVKPVAVPAGQTLFLWVIDAQGRATPVGPVPSGPFVRAPLGDVAEKVFASAVELGVTLEALGSSPSAEAATRAWVFRGLCGKVWRVPPAAAPKPTAG